MNHTILDAEVDPHPCLALHSACADAWAGAWTGAPALVPIRTIGAAHREAVRGHLRALERHDRYLRFGYLANDEQIDRYVDGLDFRRDELFGVFNRELDLIAMAHLAFMPNGKDVKDGKDETRAEFGVSVSRHARGRGYGSKLFERAVMRARNAGVSQIFIHALSENAAMLRIASKAGAVIERDGSESEAKLRLPPADVQSWTAEFFGEQLAQASYQMKSQSKPFWDAMQLLRPFGLCHIDRVSPTNRD